MNVDIHSVESVSIRVTQFFLRPTKAGRYSFNMYFTNKKGFVDCLTFFCDEMPDFKGFEVTADIEVVRESDIEVQS